MDEKSRSYAEKMCDDARKTLEGYGWVVVPPNAETARTLAGIVANLRGIEVQVRGLERRLHDMTPPTAGWSGGLPETDRARIWGCIRDRESAAGRGVTDPRPVMTLQEAKALMLATEPRL